MYINVCVVGGKIVREPRMTQDQKGCMFTVLMEEPNRKGGDPFKTYQDVTLWDAPNVQLHQGDVVVINGSLARPRQYTNAQGEKVWNRSIVCRESGVTVVSGNSSQASEEPAAETGDDAPF